MWLIFQRQVWLSFEDWSVPNPLDLLSRPVSYSPDFLSVVQRQEEFYLKLERQKQEA